MEMKIELPVLTIEGDIDKRYYIDKLTKRHSGQEIYRVIPMAVKIGKNSKNAIMRNVFEHKLAEAYIGKSKGYLYFVHKYLTIEEFIQYKFDKAKIADDIFGVKSETDYKEYRLRALKAMSSERQNGDEYIIKRAKALLDKEEEKMKNTVGHFFADEKMMQDWSSFPIGEWTDYNVNKDEYSKMYNKHMMKFSILRVKDAELNDIYMMKMYIPNDPEAADDAVVNGENYKGGYSLRDTAHTVKEVKKED